MDAFRICFRCQDAAGVYLHRNREYLERIERKRAVLGVEPREREQLEGELRQLLRPIDDISERQLKPKLEAIPTRAQRAAASQPAGASEFQPASRPDRP